MDITVTRCYSAYSRGGTGYAENARYSVISDDTHAVFVFADKYAYDKNFSAQDRVDMIVNRYYRDGDRPSTSEEWSDVVLSGITALKEDIGDYDTFEDAVAGETEFLNKAWDAHEKIDMHPVVEEENE
jgi:hypothetical protein